MPVDMKRLIDESAAFAMAADEKKITLKYHDIPGQFLLKLDSDRMTQVIVNLIGNALSHTQVQGMVEVIQLKKQWIPMLSLKLQIRVVEYRKKSYPLSLIVFIKGILPDHEMKGVPALVYHCKRVCRSSRRGNLC